MNEWGFAGEIKSWWDASVRSHPQWHIDRCELETAVEGSQKRSDLTVLGGGVVKAAGELRLPDHPSASPWHPQNLGGAIGKAQSHGARWAFTSDGASFLLIDTQRAGPPQGRVVQVFHLVDFQRREELDAESFLAKVGRAWSGLLEAVGPIIAGLVVPSGLPTDEAFINSLRALLDVPVVASREAIDRARRADPAFEQALVTWMVEEQGWPHDPSRWDDEIRRTAQLAVYVFVTRLMFYQALRQAHASLAPLGIPAQATAPVARATLAAYMAEARRLSGDYETVFAWDRASDYALAADESIAGWHRVLDHLSAFDLANVGYDVTGKLFERLIDPHERYHWGQHYTQPDVVDLMLSFGLPDGRGSLLDPATGGGTFLVRAYERKRLLEPGQTHQDLLGRLFGLEVSAFAANLATVNLAVRNLQFEDNYPRVALRSFFQARPHDRLMRIPGSVGGALQDVSVGRVNAVVCNPPYVRLHALGPERLREAESVLSHPAGSIAVPPRLTGAANYHLYFWFHAAQFLVPGGSLVLITSGEWLDSDYGGVLQEWLLHNFRIQCVFESLAEPWFSDARVGTVVVAAQLCDEEDVRAAHIVRFATLRRPLREIYGEPRDELDHLARVDRLRDRLLGLQGAGESEDLDWATISQGDLLALGSPVAAAVPR